MHIYNPATPKAKLTGSSHYKRGKGMLAARCLSCVQFTFMHMANCMYSAPVLYCFRLGDVIFRCICTSVYGSYTYKEAALHVVNPSGSQPNPIIRGPHYIVCRHATFT